MSRTFTLSEAESLLPVLESLLRSAMQAKSVIEEVDAELEALKSRVFMNGGMFVDALAVSRRKGQREKAIQQAKDAVAEIDAAGVQVKDLDIGLLDFPCVVGEEVSCCAGSLASRASLTGTAPAKALRRASRSTSASFGARRRRTSRGHSVAEAWPFGLSLKSPA